MSGSVEYPDPFPVSPQGFKGTGLAGECGAVSIQPCVTLRLGEGAGQIRGECVLAVEK